MDVDSSYAQFLELLKQFKSFDCSGTEADTRFQIIDKIFNTVLGWDDCDFKLEQHGTSGYADYLLKDGNTNMLIVEAKKASKCIVDTKNDRMGFYIAGGPALQSANDAMKQAQAYCLDSGVTYSVITNGIQWIGFWAIREHGKPPFKGKSVVFPSLDSILNDFALFYDLFSKNGVREQLFKQYINEAEGFGFNPSDKLEAVVTEENIKLLKKTDMAADIEIILKKFFSDISGDNNAEMLAECFVESKESREAQVGLEKIARNLIDSIMLVDSGDGKQLERQIRSSVDRFSGDFVLIVGNKGAGKSTFIDRFFRIVIGNDLKKRCLLIRIDLADSEGDELTINKWISTNLVKKIESELYKNSSPTFEELQGIFYDTYNRWKTGEYKILYKTNRDQFKIEFGKFINKMRWEDPLNYAILLLKRAYTSHKKLPCIVFDNADHYPKPFQEKVFQHAQSINRACVAFMICPITDKTVWQLSKSGPFQSYHSHSFYLPVPQSKDILKKRISYLRKKVEEESKKEKKEYELTKGMRLSLSDLKGFVACIDEIFVNTDYISRIISWLSNHDIRRELRIAERIIISPFISMEDLISTWVSKRILTIPEMKIRQALLYGSYNMFRQEHSDYILNLFIVPSRNINSPLLKTSIIRFLIDLKNSASSGEEEYVSIYNISNYFDSCGIGYNTIIPHLKDLLKYRLIEPYDPTNDEVSPDQRVRITHSGLIHYEFTTQGYIYIQNMALVTPIRDLQLVDKMRGVLYSNIKMTRNDWNNLKKMFVQYLLEEDKKFLTLPTLDKYKSQAQLRRDLFSNWVENY